MSLIYTVIVRGNTVTLCDYEANPSNFSSVSKKIFGKLQQNTRKTYVLQQSYHFHYINEDDFTYLCLADAVLPKATAFAFLEEIKQQFCEKFTEIERRKAIDYGMKNEFQEHLKNRMNYYNSNPENEKIKLLETQLKTVTTVMTENIDKILDRENQIKILVHNTACMTDTTRNLKSSATQVRKDQERRALRTKLFIVGVIIAMIVIIYLLY